MKKILVLAVIAFVLLPGSSVTSQGRWEDAYENNPMCGICPMPDWVKRDMLRSGCSLDCAVCIPINYEEWGCNHYILNCLCDKKEPSPDIPVPYVSPLVSPLASPLVAAAIAPIEPELEPKPEHCFAFGFPCTDYNPAAQEGCICFCNEKPWCPN
jgi:hypothetical protein